MKNSIQPVAMTLKSFLRMTAERQLQLLSDLNTVSKRRKLTVSRITDILTRSSARMMAALQEFSLSNIDPSRLEDGAATGEAAELVSALANSPLRRRCATLDRDLRDLALQLLYVDVCIARALQPENDDVHHITGSTGHVLDNAREALIADEPVRKPSRTRKLAA